MREIHRSRGFILYEKEKGDRVREAVEQLARLSAAALDDEIAAQVGALFEEWRPGAHYTAGMRISDSAGELYRVLQDHTAQADWPMAETPALYAPLGVTAEAPGEIPEWRQPLGAADAYGKGDKVRYGGKIYVSVLNGNTLPPDVEGWEETEK